MVYMSIQLLSTDFYIAQKGRISIKRSIMDAKHEIKIM